MCSRLEKEDEDEGLDLADFVNCSRGLEHEVTCIVKVELERLEKQVCHSVTLTLHRKAMIGGSVTLIE